MHSFGFRCVRVCFLLHSQIALAASCLQMPRYSMLILQVHVYIYVLSGENCIFKAHTFIKII